MTARRACPGGCGVVPTAAALRCPLGTRPLLWRPLAHPDKAVTGTDTHFVPHVQDIVALQRSSA